MYQREGRGAFKKDLTNISELCQYLGNAQNHFKSVHIAGTNGKGSTAHILSAIYQNNGYKVGLYTSPHLLDFRERIRINGEMVRKEFVIKTTQKLKPIISKIQPSFFEITVAMAFAYFDQENVDIAIVETGLGGRLDSTNILRPLATIITTIDYDHTDLLGETLEEIAYEKAGIIKQKTPLILGEKSKHLQNIFRNVCNLRKAKMYLSTIEKRYATDLLGNIQQENVAMALKAVQILQEMMPTKEALDIQSLTKIRELTKLRGRFEIVQKEPWVILDVGHNVQAIEQNLNEIKKIDFQKCYFLLGFVKGKNIENILERLSPIDAEFHFTEPNIMRKLELAELSKVLNNKFKKKYQIHQNVQVAFEKIYKKLNKDDLLFIGGSTFIVSDFIAHHNAN